MYKYEYLGPVYEFDTLINDNWFGQTCAISEKKAKSNLIYQYKKSHGKSADTKIKLTGKLNVVETRGERKWLKQN